MGLAWATYAGATDYVIRNVNLIDGSGKAMQVKVSVFVKDGRIADIQSAGANIPRGWQVLDGSRKYLVPGLWDMHVHLADVDESAIPIFVTYGITTVRDMGGDPDRIKAWRDQVEQGQLVGPRIKFCGPMLEGEWEQKPGERTDHWVVATPEDASSIVKRLANEGVDCIKMRSYKTPETYFALARAAREAHLPLVGHAPWGIDAIKASEAGQKSFEHAFYPWPWDKISAEEKRNVEDTFRLNSSLLVPTFIAWQTFLLPEATIQAVMHDVAGESAPRLKDVSPALRKNWISGAADVKKMVGGDDHLPGWQKAMDAAYAQVKEMHDHGVGVMAGTDTGATLVYPGAALHQELKLLVRKCGFTPMDALLAATIVPAKFFGLEDHFGTIQKGKITDLVLVSKNPMEDIENLRLIEGVMLRGRWLDRADLQKLTRNTEANIREQYLHSRGAD